METVNEVLIIEENGMRTSCFIVENMPYNLVYHKVKKLMPIEEYSDRLVPAFTIDLNGKRVPTGEMVDELLPGLHLDGAGSGGLICHRGNTEDETRLAAIDAHIEQTITNPALRYKRVPYAANPGDPQSYPRPRNLMPRVRLPIPDSPPTVPTVDQGGSLAPKKSLSPEHLAKLKENAAKARAAKAQKE
jgi:hypothetical protein